MPKSLPTTIHPRKGPLLSKLAPAKFKITIRQLLNHSNALSYDLGKPALKTWRQSRGETPLSLWARVVGNVFAPLGMESSTSIFSPNQRLFLDSYSQYIIYQIGH
jgi:CubicO group peptidase (beta-lactamase class C family)